MGLHLRGLVVRRIFASEIWGAYFWEGLIIGILWYYSMRLDKKEINMYSRMQSSVVDNGLNQRYWYKIKSSHCCPLVFCGDTLCNVSTKIKYISRYFTISMSVCPQVIFGKNIFETPQLVVNIWQFALKHLLVGCIILISYCYRTCWDCSKWTKTRNCIFSRLMETTCSFHRSSLMNKFCHFWSKKTAATTTVVQLFNVHWLDHSLNCE